MQPRGPHYQYAHRLLAQDAHRPQGDIWAMLAGPNAAAYLAMKWDLAGGAPEEFRQIRVVLCQPMAGHHLIVVAMPRPLAPTEAHYVAYARPAAGGPARYFVMEKGICRPGEGDRAYIAEHRADGMRIRHGDLPAVTVEAFTGQLMQELSNTPQVAPAVAPFQQSMPPMSMHRAAQVPAKGGNGKWIALGLLGLVGGGGFTAYTIYNHLEMEEWRERRAALDAEADEAQDANKAARKRAKARIDEIDTAHAQCLRNEREMAKKTLELARSKRVLKGRNARPKKKDTATLSSAIPYLSPTDQRPATAAFGSNAGTNWIPVSPWIARASSNCLARPKAQSELSAIVLGEAISEYASSRQKKLETETDKIESLMKSLESAPAQPTTKPSSVAVVSNECKSTSVMTYKNATGDPLTPDRMFVYRYACTAKVSWITLNGERLAHVTAKGSAHPGRLPPTTTVSDLSGINKATEAKARQNAADVLQKTVNGWGGGAKK